MIAAMEARSVHAADCLTQTDKVLQKAAELHLCEDPAWLALGHYRRDGKGWMSTVDDPRFFLADRGKTDPNAELVATIRGFFAAGTNIEKHATSRFVARLAWLRERCLLSADDIPIFKDTAYTRLLAEVRPTRIFLAFPAPVAEGMNSAFGHVFLIFVHADRSPLLAPTISYAALIDKTGGPFYPILGLWGGFKAYFTAMPYAERLKEYNSIAFRDMWEFELDLTPDEVERIFQHAWELRHIYSRYYFLGENCAYGVLALLDVARPGLCSPVFDRRLFILPLDVVRRVRELGLVKSTRYVPSVLTALRMNAQMLSDPEIGTSKDMATGDESKTRGLLETTNTLKQSTMLNVAMSLAQIRATKGKASVHEHQQIQGSLFRAAQSVAVEKGYGLTPVMPEFPEAGHRSSRLSAGMVRRGGENYGLVGIRPAYHDLLDPSAAMDAGVQLQFFASEVLLAETSHIAEWQLVLADMEALKPCDALYAPLSHRFMISTIYRNNTPLPEGWDGTIEGGVGFSYALYNRSLLFGLGEFSFESQTRQNDPWFGLGPSIGFVSDLPGASRTVLRGEWQINGVASDCTSWELSAAYSVEFAKQMNALVQYAAGNVSGEETRTELRLEARLYF